jgi:hypothetical protein
MLDFLGNKANFKGLIAIPHADAPEGGLTDEDLKRWQHELLAERLGMNTYKLLIDHVSDTSGMWYDLINGCWYQESDGHWRYWNGLVNKDTGLGIVMYYCRLMYAKEYFVNSGRGNFASVTVGKNQQAVPFYNLGVIGEKIIDESISLNKFMRDMQRADESFAPDYIFNEPLNLIDNPYGI